MLICMSLGHLMMFSFSIFDAIPILNAVCEEWHPVVSAFPPFLPTLHITSLGKIPFSKDQFGVFVCLCNIYRILFALLNQWVPFLEIIYLLISQLH